MGMARGATFLTRLEASHDKIVAFSQPFLASANAVLVHGSSSLVTGALIHANKTRDMEVVITKSSGKLYEHLKEANISCRMIDDLAVGADGVVETGGIVNQLGSYTIALISKALNKQTYVLAESFKFVREYPLVQEDLAEDYLYSASDLLKNPRNAMSPRVDYTPPNLVSLLFTDLGILTPSAVSDELINLYL